MCRLLLMMPLILMLGACSVGPDYVRPDIQTPEQWRVKYDAAAKVANTAWWGQFGDPVLDDLVKTALAENLDVKIAAARVDQYLGQLAVTRSQFFPQIGADLFTASRQRTTGAGTPAVPPVTYNAFQSDLNFSWEIDLWGRIRRSTESARAQVLASEEGRRAVVLSLVTNVANGYVVLRSLDRQLEIARETEKSYAESLRLFSLRYKYGTISRLELSQVESQYEAARQAIPQYESSVAQQENLISILLGRNPGPVPRGKTIDQLVYPALPAELPLTLLERRPDVVQAEQNLVAANAQIGAAKALYFPTISLSGLLGTSAAETGKLFDPVSRIWGVGGNALMPLFTFGAISGQVAQAEALQQQAAYQYRQTVLNAFREVEDSLVSAIKGRDQLESQGRQVKALKDYARTARLQYEGGTASYLPVLDADRSLFSAELSYVQTQSNVFTSYVNTYKAMGGGWVAEADKLTAAK